jgi:hypothetical protein
MFDGGDLGVCWRVGLWPYLPILGCNIVFLALRWKPAREYAIYFNVIKISLGLIIPAIS